MQTVPGSDVRRSVLRLAVTAAVVACDPPPAGVWVGGRPEFFFSFGLPWRGLLEYLLDTWSSAIVVTVGILFLRRDQLGIAGGIFAAVALGLTILLAAQLLATAPHFGRWQTDVVFSTEIVQTILLALAAGRAIGASGTD